MARTSPGTDFFPAPPESLLCQSGTQWGCCDVDEDARDLLLLGDGVEGADSGAPRRVTVRDVLKYSLTWVIIP